jgi:multiple sugar transport system ATP-binding protein
LKDVSLAAEEKELLVLVGPSGSGKTTLLRLIAGLEEVTSGKISIDSVEVNRVEPKDRAVAMVFQNFALYPHMTVHENLAFPLKLRHLPSPEVELRVRAAAEWLGLVSHFHRLPRALSGGERQRVALGRAMVQRPKVFLLDEPLSNLDPHMRVQTRREIASLHRHLGTTMIYVTHDQTEAMTLGDRVAVLHQGRIQQIDQPLALYNRPANLFVAGFIGSPEMNFLRGRIVAADGECLFEVGDTQMWQLRLPNDIGVRAMNVSRRELILGIRPEQILLAAPDSGQPGGASDNVVKGHIQLVEPLGHETHLHARAGGVTLKARLSPSADLVAGQETALRLDLRKAHLFDPATGERI